MPRHAVRKWALLGTVLLPWALGSFAVYVTSAQYSGLGIFESYRAFEAGSNLGNALWFLLWTGISAAVCWFLVRKPGPVGAIQSASHALYCYGTPSALLVFPDAAMSCIRPWSSFLLSAAWGLWPVLSSCPSESR